MHRLAMILSFAAVALFNYGQYLGWSLFSDNAEAQQLRSSSAARAYHK